MTLVDAPREVPLVKSVIEDKDREFIPTWSEWATKNEREVIRNAFVAEETTVVMFIVPDNETFYMSYGGMTSFEDGGGTEYRCNMIITSPDGATTKAIIFSHRLATNKNQSLSQSSNFSHPIRIESGGQIQLDASPGGGTANGATTAVIIGWLEKKEVKP